LAIFFFFKVIYTRIYKGDQVKGTAREIPR